LPRGDYAISGTLDLKPNTRLFGVPGPRSRLYGPNWDPKGTYQSFVRTADSQGAKTYLGDLRIMLPSNLGLGQTYLNCLDWRAGRSSIVRRLTCITAYDQTTISQPRNLVYVEGSGGGRWYGTMLMQILSRLEHPDLRGLMVRGNTSPITFYGLNPEHQMSSAFVQLDHAAHVRIFGSKSENVSYIVTSSNNVLVSGHTGNNDNDPLLHIASSTNVAAPIFSEFGGFGSSTKFIVEAVDGAKSVGIAGNDRCSLFENGTFDASPFPVCGDGACDGAETVATCPKDCAGGGAGSTEDAGTASAAPNGGASGTGNGDIAPNQEEHPEESGAKGCACRAGKGPSSSDLGLLVIVSFGSLARRRSSRVSRAR
jgi:hypothetical protein